MDVVLEEVHRGQHVVHEALVHPQAPNLWDESLVA